MKKSTRKTIVICSSAAFYKQAIDIKRELERRGFKVEVPLTARKMVRENNFDVNRYKTWFKNAADYKRKAYLTRQHFNKVKKGDAILILNYEKNGRPGYIGGAVLMEMGLAFDYKKKIYILNPIDEESSFKEELLCVRPVILNGDISKIK